MPQGMPEIQDAAKSLFPFIHFDDALFDGAGGLNDIFQKQPGPQPDGIRILFQLMKQRFAVNDPIFDNFGQTAAVFLLREGIQTLDIHEDTCRLIVGSQQVFTPEKIDGRLSPDTAVHLCHQGRWDLNIGNASHKNGRKEARHITRYTATQGDQRRFPVHTKIEQTVGQVKNRLNCF